jgi:Fic family protein
MAAGRSFLLPFASSRCVVTEVNSRSLPLASPILKRTAGRRRELIVNDQAAVPARIARARVEVSAELLDRLAWLAADLARFDALQAARGYNLPALLLRSESSASSQIENLTSSVRNVALAEVSPNSPHNARLIAGNVAAMRTALALPDDLTLDTLRAVHRCIIEPTGQGFGGKLRDEQVWVGGSPYSPHGALFVPPHADRVPACIDDLLAYARRDDVNPVVKAAVVHAQFETIHPFIDGNGRTGRTLLHKVLRREGVLTCATLPVSAGLLHDVETYMTAIRSYQQGDPEPVVACIADALEVALTVGGLAARRIDEVLDRWRESMAERRGSSILRLPDVLVEQPVVDAKYLAERLNITPRAANNLLDRACSYGILRPVGTARRGVFYQADELIAVLEDIADARSIRRVLATGRLGS